MPSNPDADIIQALNEVLTAELTAINQYFVHAKMCQDWGYERLRHKIWHESIDEMKHADQIIERILYLGGVPNVQRYWKVNIGENVLEMLKSDLAVEDEAVPRLQRHIALMREKGDEGTRILLDDILHSEEDHRDWLEAQLSQIEQVGIQNYLAAQIRGDG